MPINRLAITSLAAAMLTLLSFCIGFAPFLPLTSIVCYPAAILLGLVSFVTGWQALGQMRSNGEGGRWMALTGLWTGCLVILAVVCATTLTLTALFTGIDYLQTLWPTPFP